MARFRSFLFPEAQVLDNVLILDPRESHHLIRVFRARISDTVEVLDGRGRVYTGKIQLPDAKGVHIVIDSVREVRPPAINIRLVQAIPKGKSMDLILRIATEIGACSIHPVFTDQGEVQIKNERLQSKFEKWRLTTIESCKQCGLPWLPELSFPVSLSDWFKANPCSEKSLRLVASLETGSLPLAEMLRANNKVSEVIVAVGPEGDFSVAEYRRLKEAGFQAVRLGQNVLRAETAAAYILSVVDQVLGQGAP